MNVVAYFQGVAAELKKVHWPTFPSLARQFASVVIGLILATAMIAAFDFTFIKLLGLIIK